MTIADRQPSAGRGTYDVPVAFIVFNRPDVTERVFAAIAKQKPRQLFIISDGPRASRAGEAEKVAVTRAITDRIDWPCDVKRNYADSNMGCKKRVASGISWVFEHVDRAVILEDDCLPGDAFFTYCRDLLLQYKDDRRVFAISGTYFGPPEDVAGHYFSNHSLMWGWATWRDRWEKYEIAPTDVSTVLRRHWWRRPVVLAYWHQIFSRLTSGALDTWDVQWLLTTWRHNALACRPTRNLVINLGFGDGATHTTDSSSSLGRMTIDDAGADFSVPVSQVVPSIERDHVDEQKWAFINWRSVVLMAFPQLARLRQAISR